MPFTILESPYAMIKLIIYRLSSILHYMWKEITQDGNSMDLIVYDATDVKFYLEKLE